MSQQIDWDAYSYLSSSSVRREVAEALQDGDKQPKELVAETSIQWTHISRALKQLREHDIAELRVPEGTHKGRIHGLTETGYETLAALQERDA